jgi:small subunit ribosomal protein S17
MPLKQRLGVVVSDKMDKTIVVSIENRVTNKRYGKLLLKHSVIKYMMVLMNVV